MEKVNFAWPVTSINYEDYEALMNCTEKNREALKEKKICIFGAGIRGTEFSILLSNSGFTKMFFTDNNPQKWGGVINNFPIIEPDKITGIKENIIVLISTEASKDIEKQLDEYGFIREQDYFNIKSQLYENYVAEFERKTSKKILIMGDCEFSKISLFDCNKKNLGQMVKDRIGENNIKILAMHGMGMRAHFNILKAQIRMNMKPEILFIMVNFDTMTGKQHLLPRSQHSELIQQICDKVSPDEELMQYLNITQERSKNFQVEISSNGLPSNNIKAKENIARIYFKLNYMYHLQEDNEGIQYLLKILRLSSKLNIKVIPFTPPLNYLLGMRLCGESFLLAYEKNLHTLKRLIENEEYSLFDLSYSCESEFFAEKGTPDETVNEDGRRCITDMLEQKIKEVM